MESDHMAKGSIREAPTEDRMIVRSIINVAALVAAGALMFIAFLFFHYWGYVVAWLLAASIGYWNRLALPQPWMFPIWLAIITLGEGAMALALG